MNESLKVSKEFLPLKREEMHEIHGGAVWAVIFAGLVIAGGSEIIADWDNFKRGLRGLPEIK